MCRRNEMMIILLCFSLIFGLVFQCVDSANDIGCLFSPKVCENDEQCYDDNAFGRCQLPYSPDVDDYQHLLGSETTKLLERELTRLFAGGYRWHHKYTQCVVQNILYSNRHKISYDPGFCSRVMQFTLPDVPPEILSALESPDPDELAYIKFKPNRDDPESAMFADEIFNPPVQEEKDIEVKEAKKRSTSSVDSEYASSVWIKKESDNDYDKADSQPEITDKKALFKKLLEAADETGKLFEEFKSKQTDRYPDEDLPVIKTELSSDLNQRPIFSEGGTEWVPVGHDVDYMLENDLMDNHEKKRVRNPDEFKDTNDIELFQIEPFNDIRAIGKEPFKHSRLSEKDSFKHAKPSKPFNDIRHSGKESFNDIRLPEKEPFNDMRFSEKEPFNNIRFLEKEPFNDIRILEKEPFSDIKVSEKEPFSDIRVSEEEPFSDIRVSEEEPFSDLKAFRKEPLNGVTLLEKGLFNDDMSAKENDMQQFSEEGRYDNYQDDEDKNFRWNYKHINRGIDDDLTKFARKHKDGRNRGLAPSENRNLHDVIEDDYLEDQLYAILPMDRGMSTFTRDMRYDTKKPGPTYMIHDDEDDDMSHDGINMAADGARILFSSLSKTAREAQLLALLKTPVVAQKSSTLVVPSQEVIAQRIVVADDGESPSYLEQGRNSKQSNEKPLERLHADQPEVLEGIGDLTSKDAKVEDRMANAAQTGEGHIGHYDTVDATHAYLLIKEKEQTEDNAKKLVETLGSLLNLPKGTFSNIRIEGTQITFKVNPNTQNLNASDVAAKAEEQYIKLKELTGVTVEAAGIGDKVKYEVINPNKERRLFILAFALCGGVAGILLAVAAAYLFRRHSQSREKLQNVAQNDTEPSQDYQDLCRQRMASKANDKPENIHSTVHSPKRIRSLSQEGQASSSSHSSTSSWNEEPVTSNMDISTGHIILAYMEDHLKNKDRLDREWEGLCAYEAELCSTATASLPQNIKKNRYTDVLPYDHSRVLVTEVSNVSSSDYINASSITDHDPRNPAYIATQGPLPQTAADFWQMIWEQGSVVIVMLSRLMENGVAMCHRYWPEEGSEVYHIYEVHLVSEHIWCDDYLVRSFYLKNLRTNETRTVTQFHFMSWPDNGVPNSTKALLEFRRKVNKSYRGRSCPIVVHCSDGIGRTGTYCLIDMVLNRMAKGAKEIDIAATLEHVRDQRAGMVKTKAQFEFVLMAIAEEVHAILKALSH